MVAMGLAIARVALRRGHKVSLVVGPIRARLPAKAEIIKVETAEQMARACFGRFARTDCVVMAAAVTDYTPVECQQDKIKKSKAPMSLRLKPTTDILAELGRRKRGQLLIGFALDTERLEANATAKLKDKRLDYIVANEPKTLGSEQIEATILSSNGSVQRLGTISKQALARRLVMLCERQRQAGRKQM